MGWSPENTLESLGHHGCLSSWVVTTAGLDSAETPECANPLERWHGQNHFPNTLKKKKRKKSTRIFLVYVFCLSTEVSMYGSNRVNQAQLVMEFSHLKNDLFFFFKDLLYFTYVYVCMCVCKYKTHAYRYPQRPEVGTDPLQLELQGVKGPPVMDARN